MDDLKRMAIFATVVQRGSLSAAARWLDMSPSAVSQHIRQLEREAGVTLLHRSTRQISLSAAGQRFFTHAQTMQAAAERARAELAAEREQPSGELRLAAPVSFAVHVAPALGAWLQQHPQLRLQLLLDDTHIDLLQARVDLAVRYGRLPDSSWVARPLGRSPAVLCAAPQWLHQWNQAAGRPLHHLPQHPQELLHATWLDLSRPHTDTPPAPEVWQHTTTGERYALQPQPHLCSNYRGAVQHLCEAGLGIAPLTLMDVAPALRAGRLVQLLAHWDMGQLPLWAVTPQRDAVPAKVRQAMAALQHYFGQLAGVQA